VLELVCKKSGDGSLQGELPLEADLRDGFQSDLSNIGVVACDKKERKPLRRTGAASKTELHAWIESALYL